MSKTNDDAMLGVSSAANILRCSEATIRNYANAGRLPHIRDSSGKRLFKRGTVEAFKRKAAQRVQ